MPDHDPSAHSSQSIHEVDGIQEEDNQLPRWWLATFFLAIGFGYFYWQYYQIYREGPSLLTDYYNAKDRIPPPAPATDGEFTDAKLVEMSKGPDAAEGGKVFAVNCVACHGVNAEGKIGPNLTDSYWLHGGKPTDIVATISNGYALKAMPAWLPVLGPTKVRQAAAYVVSLRGKQAKGRAPEGLEVAADGSPLTPPHRAPPLTAAAPPPGVN